MRCSAISYSSSTEKRCLLHALSSSLIYVFIKCPRHLTSADFQLHILANLSLVQTNPRLKSYVRVTQEMSPRGDEKYLETFQNIQIHFTSILHHLTVGLKFDLWVKCKEGLPSGVTFFMECRLLLSATRSHCESVVIEEPSNWSYTEPTIFHEASLDVKWWRNHFIKVQTHKEKKKLL